MIDLDALFAEADALIAEAEPELVPARIGKRLVGVRFLPMSGAEWRKHVLKHPPQNDVVRDMSLGYNLDAVISTYPDVALVVGDEVDDMIRTDAEGKSESAWPAVWKRLTATSQKDVSQAIWAAHELTPELLVDAAGKASAGSREKKQR